ncbi:Rho guanine nucleotide exchange factor [Entamoeba marina]
MDLDRDKEQCFERTFDVEGSWIITVNINFVYVLKKRKYDGMIDILLSKQSQNHSSNSISLTLTHQLIPSFGIYMNYCSPSDLRLHTFDPVFVVSSLCRFGVPLRNALSYIKEHFQANNYSVMQNFVSSLHISVVDVMMHFDNKESCKEILFPYLSNPTSLPIQQLKNWLLPKSSLNSSESTPPQSLDNSEENQPKLSQSPESLTSISSLDCNQEMVKEGDKIPKTSQSAHALKQLASSGTSSKGLNRLSLKNKFAVEPAVSIVPVLKVKDVHSDDNTVTISSHEHSPRKHHRKNIQKKTPRHHLSPLQITSVVVLQSRIRSYQSRKLYDLYTKRKECLLELYQTEQNLHKTMTLMDIYYRSSLLALNKDESFNKNVNQVFLTLPRCITSSALFISKLKENLLPFNTSTCVGDVLRMLITYITPYLSFTTDYNIALATWKKLKTMSCVKQLIQKNSLIPELQTTTLELLLIQPVQRIMRYPMLIKEAFKVTPRGHPDRSCLKKAYKEYHFFCKLANERSKMRDSLQEIALELDKDDLVVENRYHLLTLPLPTRRNVKVMLFNDMILLSKKTLSTNRPEVLETLKIGCDIDMNCNGKTLIIKKYGVLHPLTLELESIRACGQMKKLIEKSILEEWFNLNDDRTWLDQLENSK